MFKRIVLGVFLLLVAWIAWELITFPDVAKLAKEPPKTTAFMERRKELLRSQGKDDTIRYRWVPYSRISSYLRRGVLVAEDNSFYEHQGVDVKGMKEALERDWKRKKITHGGSTITQQLAKNLYLSPSRNPVRKLREYFIARALEKHLSKKRILEIYLNVVEMGERVYGAEAASQFYFKKSASALTPREAALLAGCLPNPRVMNPGDPNKRLRARQNMILSRMRRWGHLVEQEVERAPAPKAPAPEPVTDTVATDTDTDTAATDSATETTATEPTTDTTTTETSTESPPEADVPPTDTNPVTTTT